MSASAQEILEPSKADEVPTPPVGISIQALLVQQFQNRPDLLLDTIEKHDPGFTKRTFEEVQERSRTINRMNTWARGAATLISVVLHPALVVWLA